MNRPHIEYLLRLADDRLILGHRLSEWCGHAPILEEDIALANIALDCIGQANFLYEHAAKLTDNGATADSLVYFREALEYRNLLLVEQPNVDFAQTIVRQVFIDAYSLSLYERLQQSRDTILAGIAQKAVKEIRYHLRHSGHWLLRLGDGTEESHHRTQEAVDRLWKFTDEMFASDELESAMADTGIAVLSGSLRADWDRTLGELFRQATLTIPSTDAHGRTGGRTGRHTEHLGHLLAEMQIVARSFPDIPW